MKEKRAFILLAVAAFSGMITGWGIHHRRQGVTPNESDMSGRSGNLSGDKTEHKRSHDGECAQDEVGVPIAPSLDSAMEQVATKSLVASYVERLEKGDTRSSSRLRTAIVEKGNEGKVALMKMIEGGKISVEVRETLRRTHDEIP